MFFLAVAKGLYLVSGLGPLLLMERAWDFFSYVETNVGPGIRHPLPASINRCYHTKRFFFLLFYTYAHRATLLLYSTATSGTLLIAKFSGAGGIILRRARALAKSPRRGVRIFLPYNECL